MSIPNETFDPYAGQYPPPKSARKTSEPSTEPFYLVDPYKDTYVGHSGSFQTCNSSRSSHSYNDPRLSQTYSDPRSSQTYSYPRSSQTFNDSRSSRRYSGSRSSQIHNNSRSSSLPLSDHSRRSESTLMNSNNQPVVHNPENMKSDYHDPEALSLREYLEAEREEKMRIRKEVEMELTYSQPSAKSYPMHYTHQNVTNTRSKQGKNKRETKHGQDLENDKYNYKKSYSLHSIFAMILLIFFLLAGVGLIVADRIILAQCDCDVCIECSTTFHQGFLYSGIALVCFSGAIPGFKILRKICC